MRSELILAAVVVVLGAAGTYLLLPHKHGARTPRTVHALGAALAGAALAVFAFSWTPPGPWISGLFFYVFALASVACAGATVAARNPVHSALWFAAVVLSTSGLFLQAGAQFLAAGTVIVYAGAIIVTFLFVIMLAQMEGRAPYDRAARMPFRATFTCFLLFFGVVWSLVHIPGRSVSPPIPNDGKAYGTVSLWSEVDRRLPRPSEHAASVTDLGARLAVSEVSARAVRPTARLDDATNRVKPHVAGLGETLYTDHLVVVELTGALLFVALIGALAIAAPRPPIRPKTETRGAAGLAASTSTPTTANV